MPSQVRPALLTSRNFPHEFADPRDWALTVLNKAIAQYEPGSDWVVTVWGRLERMDDTALARVRDALDGRVSDDGLDDDGYELFYDCRPRR